MPRTSPVSRVQEETHARLGKRMGNAAAPRRPPDYQWTLDGALGLLGVTLLVAVAPGSRLLSGRVTLIPKTCAKRQGRWWRRAVSAQPRGPPLGGRPDSRAATNLFGGQVDRVLPRPGSGAWARPTYCLSRRVATLCNPVAVALVSERFVFYGSFELTLYVVTLSVSGRRLGRRFLGVWPKIAIPALLLGRGRAPTYSTDGVTVSS